MPTQIFLVTLGAGSWPDPGNWNPAANIVECIGSGGGSLPSGDFGGGGGGGGAYAIRKNMTVTFPVSYVISQAAGATNFNSNTGNFLNSGNVVSAQAGFGGSNGPGGPGGSPGTGAYPAGFAGGAGGSSASAAGGGGGAGGPHGAGIAGVAGSGSTFGAGGTADGGVVAGGAGGGGAGNSGMTWDLSHGSGSGGGGGTLGGAGGNYGGGAGGNAGPSSSSPGSGIIVITYLPLGATQIFILPSGGGGGPGSFPDPGNWNPGNNLVEVVSAGGQGGGFNAINPNGGGGGGGGAYAYRTNMALTFPVPYYLYGPGSATAGNSCNFGIDSSQFTSAGNVVSASNGSAALSGGQGGGAGLQFYPNGHAGGNGASWSSVAPTNGGGGGGAGGPHGAGLNASASGTTYANAGAAGDGGVTPAQTTPATAGFSGSQFNPWAVTANGIGGGGSGGISTAHNGGAAGSYGGGGGGAYQASGGAFGLGGSGIVVLTYTPFSLATQVGIVRYWQTSAPGTKYMWMTIIPTYDSELNNPSWTSNILTGATGWSWDMVRIPLTQYNGYANFAAFQAAVLAM